MCGARCTYFFPVYRGNGGLRSSRVAGVCAFFGDLFVGIRASACSFFRGREFRLRGQEPRY